MILIISLLSTGCGYHVDSIENVSYFSTISVPYFRGDKNGELTDAVIMELSSLGQFSYVDKEGTIILEGTIIQNNNENLGYKYDRHSISGKRFNRLVSSEARREIKVRISLIDSRSQKIVYGPFEVSAYNDYDFVNSDSLQDTSFINQTQERESVLFFSLGQLDSSDGGYNNSCFPIYKRLAVKIIEGISNLPYNDELKDISKY